MNILIVDGNEKEASDQYRNMGMDTQYEVYNKVLDNLTLNNVNISVRARASGGGQNQKHVLGCCGTVSRATLLSLWGKKK